MHRVNQDAGKCPLFHQEKLRREEWSWNLEDRAFQKNPKCPNDPNGNAPGAAVDPGKTKYPDSGI